MASIEWNVLKSNRVPSIHSTTGVFIYYYLLYYTVDLGSNPYVNVVLTAVTEAPFSVVSYFVIRFCHRKPVYLITYSCVIAPLVVLLFVPKSKRRRLASVR